MTRVHNFNPGPAVLPEEVLEWAAAGVRDLDGSGMSVLEISHRGLQYRRIQEDATERLLRLMDLDAEEYTVLYLGGGASLQFYMVPLNFLKDGDVADYVDTGSWARKAMAEGRRVGQVHVAGSSEDRGYGCLPEEIILSPSPRYVHITTNNTIEGTQWHETPDFGAVPLVADMSSDFLSCTRGFRRFSLMYAGAQKNAGPAGVTIVVARREFLAEARTDLPPMLSYAVHERESSCYNTPPVFGVYVVGLVCRWLEEQGGIAAIEERNRAKARLIYDALDAHPEVYEPTVQEPRDRSLMNITFRLREPDREKRFLEGAEARGMVGLKGHRSVGGFRASCYNALPMRSAEALATYLEEFARSGG